MKTLTPGQLSEIEAGLERWKSGIGVESARRLIESNRALLGALRAVWNSLDDAQDIIEKAEGRGNAVGEFTHAMRNPIRERDERIAALEAEVRLLRATLEAAHVPLPVRGDIVERNGDPLPLADAYFRVMKPQP